MVATRRLRPVAEAAEAHHLSRHRQGAGRRRVAEAARPRRQHRRREGARLVAAALLSVGAGRLPEGEKNQKKIVMT